MQVRLGFLEKDDLDVAEKLIEQFFSTRNKDFNSLRAIEKQCLPEDFNLDNYLVISIGATDLYAVMRFKRRNMIINGNSTDSAIGTDFIVNAMHPLYSTANNLQATKMINDKLASLVPGIVLGDARRELGNYLTKFGYFSIGNYVCAEVENLRLQKTQSKSLEFHEFSIKSVIPNFLALKNRAESQNSLRIVRPDGGWVYIARCAAYLKGYRLFMLKDDMRISSYLIVNSANEIIEFGLDEDLDLRLSLQNLMAREGISRIRLDLNNKIYSYLYNLDFKITFRVLRGKGEVARLGYSLAQQHSEVFFKTDPAKNQLALPSNLFSHKKSITDTFYSSAAISQFDWI